MIRTFVLALTLCLAAFATGAATAQATYLDEIASDPESTRGQARLLHYLPRDIPIEVHVELPDRRDAVEARDRVVGAFSAWQEAVPDVLAFRFVEVPTETTLRVQWQEFDDGRVGSYAYRFHVLETGAYRFWTTDVALDPRHGLDDLSRYALLQVGHAVGLLGRSPFAGDAMSAVPSGQVTARDVATLRSLYALPSGTAVNP